MRGERPALRGGADHQSGSSPHARGTRNHLLLKLRRLRFIPACAGNARAAAVLLSTRTVHPRMRGERCRLVDGLETLAGSSPHARGTQRDALNLAVARRFIPACAGNALLLVVALPASAVHPRMRGERDPRPGLAGVSAGSSPHARGTLPKIQAVGCLYRFIPACAGNACSSRTPMSCRTVHPRMRGERLAVLIWAVARVGSSPHARGTRRHQRNPLRRNRFIPACAGNAPAVLTERGERAVHPRMRGERIRKSRPR